MPWRASDQALERATPEKGPTRRMELSEPKTTNIHSLEHTLAFLTVPSSGLYLALSSSGSDFHIWPKVHSRCELRKLRGRSGRCSWQKTV